MADLPHALCFAVDALKDSIQQVSGFALLTVYMRRILWLKNCSAELPCRKLLTGFPFHGDRLFDEDLDKYIQKISGGNCVLLLLKRKDKRPFKFSNTLVPRTSASRQYQGPLF